MDIIIEKSIKFPFIIHETTMIYIKNIFDFSMSHIDIFKANSEIKSVEDWVANIMNVIMEFLSDGRLGSSKLIWPWDIQKVINDEEKLCMSLYAPFKNLSVQVTREKTVLIGNTKWQNINVNYEYFAGMALYFATNGYNSNIIMYGIPIDPKFMLNVHENKFKQGTSDKFTMKINNDVYSADTIDLMRGFSDTKIWCKYKEHNKSSYPLTFEPYVLFE